MKIEDFKTTPLECDRRTWVYSNGNSITFSEIEQDLNNKIKNMRVRLYGEYDEKNLTIEPYVFARFETKDGYVSTLMLEKKMFNSDNLDSYYDYLVKNIANKFAKAMFIKNEND